MKVIIAGSRNVDPDEGRDSIEKGLELSGWLESITEIVSGTARGIDRLGEEYAKKHNIPVKRFPADWDRFGKSAGYRRNVQMGEYADALLAVWDGSSRGTSSMIDIMDRLEKPVFIVYI